MAEFIGGGAGATAAGVMGAGLGGLSQVTNVMDSMGDMAQKMAGAKLAKTFDSVREASKPKNMKEMGKAMGALKGAATSYGLSMLLWALEKMGILTPIFKVFGAILAFIGGVMMQKLMPLFTRFLDVMTSPEMMELFEVIAEILVAALIPALDLLVVGLELLRPHLPAICAALRDLTPAIAFLLNPIIGLIWGVTWLWEVLEPLAPAFIFLGEIFNTLVANHIALFNLAMWALAPLFDIIGLCLKQFMIDLGLLMTALGIIALALKPVTDYFQYLGQVTLTALLAIGAKFSAWLNSLINPLQNLAILIRFIIFEGLNLLNTHFAILRDVIKGTISPLKALERVLNSLSNVGTGGGKKKSGGGGKKWYEFQEGGILPHTGWFYGHEGEEVKTAADTSAKESQIDDMLDMQMESLEYQKKLYILMRDRV